MQPVLLAGPYGVSCRHKNRFRGPSGVNDGCCLLAGGRSSLYGRVGCVLPTRTELVSSNIISKLCDSSGSVWLLAFIVFSYLHPVC